MPKFNRLVDGQKDGEPQTMVTGMRTVLESLSDSSWWLLNDLCK
jgi:hypothetical protein